MVFGTQTRNFCHELLAPYQDGIDVAPRTLTWRTI